jgi:hypothetical protein
MCHDASRIDHGRPSRPAKPTAALRVGLCPCAHGHVVLDFQPMKSTADGCACAERSPWRSARRARCADRIDRPRGPGVAAAAASVAACAFAGGLAAPPEAQIRVRSEDAATSRRATARCLQAQRARTCRRDHLPRRRSLGAELQMEQAVPSTCAAVATITRGPRSARMADQPIALAAVVSPPISSGFRSIFTFHGF